MAVYVLTYDLNNETSSSAYKPLIDELKKFGAHRILESVWLVSNSASAKDLHDHFKDKMDGDDALFVSKVTKPHYHYSGAKSGTNDWIKSNPPGA